MRHWHRRVDIRTGLTTWHRLEEPCQRLLTPEGGSAAPWMQVVASESIWLPGFLVPSVSGPAAGSALHPGSGSTVVSGPAESRWARRVVGYSDEQL